MYLIYFNREADVFCRISDWVYLSGQKRVLNWIVHFEVFSRLIQWMDRLTEPTGTSSPRRWMTEGFGLDGCFVQTAGFLFSLPVNVTMRCLATHPSPHRLQLAEVDSKASRSSPLITATCKQRSTVVMDEAEFSFILKNMAPPLQEAGGRIMMEDSVIINVKQIGRSGRKHVNVYVNCLSVNCSLFRLILGETRPVKLRLHSRSGQMMGTLWSPAHFTRGCLQGT